MGAENASYELVDQDDLIYSPGLYRPLSSGKQIVYFLTEMDSLFKLINVTPDGSDPIYINWWMTPNASNDRMKIRYYGIVDSSVNSDEQMMVLQVSVQNQGNEGIYVTPFNFTLFDQWGWPYQPTLGFDPETVAPGSATPDRLLIGFTGLSPAFRPAALAYDYGTSNQMVIEFEKDYVPLSDEVVYGTASVSNATGNDTSVATAPLPATTPEVQPVNQTAAAEQAPASENASTKVGSIAAQIAASKARLNARMSELDKMTPDENDTVAQNNSTATSI
jgi:hypothetical protein